MQIHISLKVNFLKIKNFIPCIRFIFSREINTFRLTKAVRTFGSNIEKLMY